MMVFPSSAFLTASSVLFFFLHGIWMSFYINIQCTLKVHCNNFRWVVVSGPLFHWSVHVHVMEAINSMPLVQVFHEIFYIFVRIWKTALPEENLLMILGKTSLFLRKTSLPLRKTSLPSGVLFGKLPCSYDKVEEKLKENYHIDISIGVWSMTYNTN